MATLYGLGRGFYAYVSDDGNTYQVAITANDASTGGFGAAVAYGSLPVYPRGWKMRVQYGLSSGGIRTKWPVATTGTQWASPVNTTAKNGIAFVPQGSVGEKRTAKS
jgi:hypothetical protein